MSYQPFLDSYLQSLVRNEKTIRTKKFLMKHLETFGWRSIWDFQTVKEFYEYLESKGLKPSTIKETIREVKAFLRFLKDSGVQVMLDERAFKKLWDYKKLKAKKRKEVFSDQELDRFFAYCDKKPPIYKVFFLLLLHSGLRVNEALSLLPEDLKVKKLGDKEVLFLSVREGKFSKQREVPMVMLSEEEKNFFKRFFLGRKGKPLWSYLLKYPKSVKEKILNYWAVVKFCQMAEKELDFSVYPHKFRYTWISKMLAMGFSPHAVAQWAGHEKVQTTLETYAVVLTEQEIMKLWNL
ncbi:MAG: tyrosine-type recombinase/integrase [Hydrogenobacter sp.]